MSRSRKPAAVVAAAAILASGVAAAVTATGASAEAHAAALTPVKITVSPTISSVDVWYAYRSGLFKKEGINAKVSIGTASGPATFPEVLNGQINFTVTDPVSAILAIRKGLPLQIGAEGNVVDGTPSKDYVGIMVKKGSGLKSAKDLDGKTVAVNALDSILQMWTQVTVDAAGGKSSTVKFVEIPPLSEVDAVSKGQVNALTNVEPLLSAGEAAGEVILAHPPASVGGLPEDVLVTSKAFAKAQPKVLKGFQTAMGLANKALSKNPKLQKSTALAVKELTKAQEKSIILPAFSTTGQVPASALTKLQKYMRKYKFITSAVAPSKLLGQS